ncbi:MAG: ABC transporter ATP-binding protein [Lachnospiraceae bacterium]|nr:ABC transporter ATP-binding protein [Lachnospiraceae bacterium]
MSELVNVSNLTMVYDKRKTALNELSLTIPRGKIVGLLGPNGSGKTTLIKILNGLLCPTSGTALINGSKPGPETKARVSYLPERTYLQTGMKVKELIAYFTDFYADFKPERAKEMLTSLGIDENDRIKTLSKGTREKVQLILVMSRDADLFILDEPIAGVDPAARDYIIKTIITNYNENATVLLSTHLISDIENILDEVIFIKNGNLVLQATVEDIREQKGKSVDAYFREVFAC